MKNYYIAEVRVIIDGGESVIVKISGQGYDPNFVKKSAEDIVREQNKGKNITSVILNKIDLNIDQYRQATSGNPAWLGPFEKEKINFQTETLPKMGNTSHPTFANGKICYIEIPAIDLNHSVAFYEKVFGWQIRYREDGTVSFDDAVGEVSGTWITGRKPATEIGFLISIMIDDIATTLDLIVTHGGKIIQPVGMDAPEITARFSDPAGNVMSLYQQRAE